MLLKLDHKNLIVYQKSILLVKQIYDLTVLFPKEEVFGLTSQMRRASVSIISNIAEGASRKSESDRKRFYEIARSSLVELDTQLELSVVLNYTKYNSLELISEIINEIFAILSKMVK